MFVLTMFINMDYNRRFVLAKQRQYVQVQKAMYSLTKKSRQLLLPIHIIFQLFDHTVVPILLYGCEVWGMRIVISLKNFTWNSVEWYYMSKNLLLNV